MNEGLLFGYRAQVAEMEVMLEIMYEETNNSQLQLDEIEKARFGIRCIEVRIKQLEELVKTEDEEDESLDLLEGTYPWGTEEA